MTVSITVSVTASVDDGAELSGSWQPDDATVEAGPNIFVGTYHPGLRFQNVGIPTSASIASADITLRQALHPNRPGYPSGTWYGNDSDDSPVFSSAGASSSPTTLDRTSATATWINASSGTYTEIEHDVTNIVQEIVNRSGWSSGNAMSFFAILASASASSIQQAFYGVEAKTANSAFGLPTDATPYISISYTPPAVEIDAPLKSNALATYPTRVYVDQIVFTPLAESDSTAYPTRVYVDQIVFTPLAEATQEVYAPGAGIGASPGTVFSSVSTYAPNISYSYTKSFPIKIDFPNKAHLQGINASCKSGEGTIAVVVANTTVQSGVAFNTSSGNTDLSAIIEKGQNLEIVVHTSGNLNDGDSLFKALRVDFAHIRNE